MKKSRSLLDDKEDDVIIKQKKSSTVLGWTSWMSLFNEKRNLFLENRRKSSPLKSTCSAKN